MPVLPPRRFLWSCVLLGVMLLTPIAAEAQSVIGVGVGRFMVRSAEARDGTDVLQRNQTFLNLDLGDFDGMTVGGDWLLAINDYVEAGVGVDLHQRTVGTAYTRFLAPDGGPLPLDLTSRNVSLNFLARLFPATRIGSVQPYLGGGASLGLWRYTQAGSFVDTDLTTFRGSFVDQGVAVGPVILGGVRLPLGERLLVGGEIRYRIMQASLSGGAAFAGTTLDLGGVSTLATLAMRFRD